MGNKRRGLGMVEAMTERLKREIGLGGAILVGRKQKVTTVTAADGTTTLTTQDSGTVYLVNLANGSHTFTLPALTAGWHCEIIVTVAAGSTSRDLTVTAPGDNMILSARDFTGSGAAQRHTTDTVTTVLVDASRGDLTPVGTRMKIYCDGTNYVMIATSDNQHNSQNKFVGS